MSRRFLLVGALVTVEQGSIEQLAYGTLAAQLYLLVQLVAAPYRKVSDNFLASMCSFFISVVFVTSIFYKISALTQLEELQLILSTEQAQDYTPPLVVLSIVIMGSCVGALIILAGISVVLASQERQRALLAARVSAARRLRYLAEDSEAFLPKLPALTSLVSELYPKQSLLDRLSTTVPRTGPFHLFLSHNWRHGQSEMRVVKQRLREARMRD